MLKLYNTISRQKEVFKAISGNVVKIYLCGPTVYNFIHIGNARPICVFDVLRRYLKYLGYDVIFVQNFTDIDDKIIKKAKQENLSVTEISKKYIKEYRKDARNLGILDADFNPRVTENIDEIIEMICNLIKKNFAYITKNNDVYFRTSAFPDYGKLSQRNLDNLLVGARVLSDEFKENPLDFALWKHESNEEFGFKSPWGIGRPGWHIECSTMAKKFLGENIDIHCGGQDLIFPHHENEIAQSECANGCEFAKFWLHNGFINIDEKKMSKSLGNFFTVREIADKFGYEPIRFLMISSHYRSPINFSIEVINQCKSALDRLYECRRNLEHFIKNFGSCSQKNNYKTINLDVFKKKFVEALDDDINTADAIGVFFEFVREINRNIKEFDKDYLAKILVQFDEFANILGILYNKNIEDPLEQSEIEELIAQRQEARKSRNWKLADEIRDILKKKNVCIEDTKNGVKWWKNDIC